MIDRTRRREDADAAMRLISGRLRERRMKVTAPLTRGVFLLPITITSIGLLSGFYSLISAINAHFELAAVMIAVAFVCDGLDGRAARLTHTSSQFGVEYDSLSDVVAFGVAPAGLTYMWALKPLGPWAWLVSGMYVVCAAFRLARFNVQTASMDKNRFNGLPVPGAAIMIAGSVLAYSYFELDVPRVLVAIGAPLTLALACLMVSRVPYPSFKSINLRRRAPAELAIALLLVVAFVIAMPQLSLFIVATAYILSGLYLMLLRGERIHARESVLRPVDQHERERASSADVPREHTPDDGKSS
ncbi:MAG TPA: CDP-diacylglycerol--serine O-phosphatidyltransferase [Candidatus Binataceae bacterium]|nr:CDP-diacylglycerol--serine O-phosphatidyltransferase [Candidatus Binataceae bacterium]